MLSDDEKKRVYDQARRPVLCLRASLISKTQPQYGEEGLKQQQGGGGGGGGGGGFPGGFGGFPGFSGAGGGGQRFTFTTGGRDPFEMFNAQFGGGGGFQQQQQARPTEDLYPPNSAVASLRQGKFPGHDAKHVWFVEFCACALRNF